MAKLYPIEYEGKKYYAIWPHDEPPTESEYESWVDDIRKSQGVGLIEYGVEKAKELVTGQPSPAKLTLGKAISEPIEALAWGSTAISPIASSVMFLPTLGAQALTGLGGVATGALEYMKDVALAKGGAAPPPQGDILDYMAKNIQKGQEIVEKTVGKIPIVGKPISGVGQYVHKAFTLPSKVVDKIVGNMNVGEDEKVLAANIIGEIANFIGMGMAYKGLHALNRKRMMSSSSETVENAYESVKKEYESQGVDVESAPLEEFTNLIINRATEIGAAEKTIKEGVEEVISEQIRDLMNKPIDELSKELAAVKSELADTKKSAKKFFRYYHDLLHRLAKVNVDNPREVTKTVTATNLEYEKKYPQFTKFLVPKDIRTVDNLADTVSKLSSDFQLYMQSLYNRHAQLNEAIRLVLGKESPDEVLTSERIQEIARKSGLDAETITKKIKDDVKEGKTVEEALSELDKYEFVLGRSPIDWDAYNRNLNVIKTAWEGYIGRVFEEGRPYRPMERMTAQELMQKWNEVRDYIRMAEEGAPMPVPRPRTTIATREEPQPPIGADRTTTLLQDLAGRGVRPMETVRGEIPRRETPAALELSEAYEAPRQLMAPPPAAPIVTPPPTPSTRTGKGKKAAMTKKETKETPREEVAPQVERPPKEVPKQVEPEYKEPIVTEGMKVKEQVEEVAPQTTEQPVTMNMLNDRARKSYRKPFSELSPEQKVKVIEKNYRNKYIEMPFEEAVNVVGRKKIYDDWDIKSVYAKDKNGEYVANEFVVIKDKDIAKKARDEFWNEMVKKELNHPYHKGVAAGRETLIRRLTRDYKLIREEDAHIPPYWRMEPYKIGKELKFRGIMHDGVNILAIFTDANNKKYYVNSDHLSMVKEYFPQVEKWKIREPEEGWIKIYVGNEFKAAVLTYKLPEYIKESPLPPSFMRTEDIKAAAKIGTRYALTDYANKKEAEHPSWVEREARSFLERLGFEDAAQRVVVYANPTEFPEHVKPYHGNGYNVFAWWDGRVNLNAEAIGGRIQLHRIIVDEVIGHGYIDKVIEQSKADAAKLYSMIYLHYRETPEMRKIIEDYEIKTNTAQGQIMAGKEYLAHYKWIVLEEPSLVQKIVNYLRNAIRKIGIDLGLSKSELDAFLYKAIDDAVRLAKGENIQIEAPTPVRATVQEKPIHPDVEMNRVVKGIDELSRKLHITDVSIYNFGKKMMDIPDDNVLSSLVNRVGRETSFLRAKKSLNDPLDYFTGFWGRVRYYITLPYTVANRFPEAKPVIMNRFSMIEEIGVNHAELRKRALWLVHYPKEMLNKVMDAIADLRVEGRKGVLKEEELKERFKFNDDEVYLYYKIRESMAYMADTFIRRSLLNAINLPKKFDYPVADNVELAKLYLANAIMRGADVKTLSVLSRIVEINRLADEFTQSHYVPFDRLGKWMVSIKSKEGGESEALYSFDTRREAETFATQKQKEGKFTQVWKNMRVDSSLASIPPSLLIYFRNALHILHNEGLLKDNMVEILDELKNITAVWGERFPTHLIKAKNTEGWSKDYRQAVAKYLLGLASWAAHVKYDPAYRSLLDNLAQNPRNLPLVDYIERYNKALSNDYQPFRYFNRLIFLYYLGLNPRPMLINLVQPVFNTLPYTTKYVGEAKAVSLFSQAAKDAYKYSVIYLGEKIREKKETLDQPVDTTYLEKLAKKYRREIAPDKLRILDEMLAREQLGSPAFEALAGMAKNESELVGKAMRIMGFGFRFAEFFNRAHASLVAYEIAKMKKYDPISFVDEFINNTQYYYGKLGRPLFAQNIAVAPLFTFRTYTYNWLRVMKDLLSEQAYKTFLYMLLPTLSVGGLLGVPFVQEIMDGVRAATGFDFHTWLRQKAKEEGDEDLADMAIYGLAAKAGIALSASVNPVELPSLSRYESPTEAIMRFALGVPGDMMMRLFRTGSYLSQYGDYWRAVEQVMPEFLKNFSVAARWVYENKYTPNDVAGLARTAAGEMITYLNPMEVTLRTLGFQPLKYIREFDLRERLKLIKEASRGDVAYYDHLIAELLVEAMSAKNEAGRRNAENKLADLFQEIMVKNADIMKKGKTSELIIPNQTAIKMQVIRMINPEAYHMVMTATKGRPEAVETIQAFR